MKEIILASGSLRRHELMHHLQLPFKIKIPQNEEVLDLELDVIKRIEKLAYDKAKEIFQENPEALVIGADTVLSFEDEILGKPHTKENAFRMLKRLQNKTHTVITSVCILTKEKEKCFSSLTDVTFYSMSDEEIIAYIETEEPLDKAGAYTIQDKGAIYIKEIKGDFFTVVGLPISKLYQILKEEFQLYP